ncbi:hypothetical protein KC19_4G078300 [Ceratodon purpureus]|uniref:Uncharacterized protein n=1 Tax=Ceratodon purpureus TaxID=3225 RepID=A0A8T0I9L4_CERPU|nr:hypothetical protein KC19_4G078300 [Ceratodon purpureus]
MRERSFGVLCDVPCLPVLLSCLLCAGERQVMTWKNFLFRVRSRNLYCNL